VRHYPERNAARVVCVRREVTRRLRHLDEHGSKIPLPLQLMYLTTSRIYAACTQRDKPITNIISDQKL
jgi:hypothetical protein